MSGHSKWHNIQKTKGAQDAKRAAAFTKIAKELIVAVKEGGSADPAYNSRLATVITKAKADFSPHERKDFGNLGISRVVCGRVPRRDRGFALGIKF